MERHLVAIMPGTSLGCADAEEAGDVSLPERTCRRHGDRSNADRQCRNRERQRGRRLCRRSLHETKDQQKGQQHQEQVQRQRHCFIIAGGGPALHRIRTLRPECSHEVLRFHRGHQGGEQYASRKRGGSAADRQHRRAVVRVFEELHVHSARHVRRWETIVRVCESSVRTGVYSTLQDEIVGALLQLRGIGPGCRRFIVIQQRQQQQSAGNRTCQCSSNNAIHACDILVGRRSQINAGWPEVRFGIGVEEFNSVEEGCGRYVHRHLSLASSCPLGKKSI